MSIYDKTKMMCRTWIEAINNLFSMGKELEESVDGMKGGIVKDVTLTEVDKHYTLTILYDDNTSDIVTWDDSTVGIEDITLTYDDGVYILTIILEDGTRYNFSIPVGNVVTEEELTALNLGTPDDIASSTGSLWARVKDAVSRLATNEGNITNLQGRVTTAEGNIGTLQTADTQNVKLNENQTVNGDKTFPNNLNAVPNSGTLVNGDFTGWKKVLTLGGEFYGFANVSRLMFKCVICSAEHTVITDNEIHFDANNNTIRAFIDIKSNDNYRTKDNFKVAVKDVDNSIDFFINCNGTYQNWAIYDIKYITDGIIDKDCMSNKITLIPTGSVEPEPTVGDVYKLVASPSYFKYHNEA